MFYLVCLRCTLSSSYKLSAERKGSSLEQVSPIPIQHADPASQAVTSQAVLACTSSTESSSVTTHSTSLTSSSTSPVAQRPTTSQPSSDTTSQADDVTYDDDDVFVEFGLRERTSPVDPKVHQYPPPGSYQPNITYKQEALPSTKKPKLTFMTRHLHTTTSATTGSSTYTNAATMSISSARWRLNSGQREADNYTSIRLKPSMETAGLTESTADTPSCLRNELTHTTSDVTSNACDVISSSCDVINNKDENAEAADASNERVLRCNTLPLTTSSPTTCPPLQQFNTMPAKRPTERLNLTSCSATCGSQHSDSTSTLTRDQYDDDQFAAAAQNDEIDMYQRLDRRRQRDSSEWSGYTRLTAQRTRDSVVSTATYESIPRSTIACCHAVWSTKPTDNDDDSITAGEYLHPLGFCDVINNKGDNAEAVDTDAAIAV